MRTNFPAAFAGALCLTIFGSAAALANYIETATVKADCTDFTVDATGIDLIPGDKYKVEWWFGLRNPDGTETDYNGAYKVTADDDQGDFSKKKTYDWNPPLNQNGIYSFNWGHASLYNITQHTVENTVYIDFEPSRFSCPSVFSKLCKSGLLKYGVFGMGGKMSFTSDTINGDVGIASGGSLANNAPSTINGNVNEYSSGQITGPGTVAGQIIVNPEKVQNQYNAAVQVAHDAATLTVNDGTYPGITNTTTITGSSGLNVVAITGDISLSGSETLTLSGPSDAYFVVNASGNLRISGTSSLVLSGGVTNDHVLWNFTASGANIQPDAHDVVNGVVLAASPNANLQLDGTYYGTVIGAGAISINSGAIVNSEPCKKNACAIGHQGVSRLMD